MTTPGTSAKRRPARTQLRQPLVAELIADAIRSRILGGVDGYEEFLPKQETLLDEFKVSKPSMREALRILETEGLIRVRRGKQGGASIHRPEAQDAAYMLGIVLQSKRVDLVDVGSALRWLEPSCAALCASLPERTDIVAALREIQGRAEASVDDEIDFVEEMRCFHEAIVDGCGNETMKVLVGSLTTIWTAEEREWARAIAGSTDYPDVAMRRKGLRAHERLMELIEAGEADRTLNAYYHHLCASQVYTLSSSVNEHIDAAVLRR